jgi:hypothetical protein
MTDFQKITDDITLKNDNGLFFILIPADEDFDMPDDEMLRLIAQHLRLDPSDVTLVDGLHAWQRVSDGGDGGDADDQIMAEIAIEPETLTAIAEQIAADCAAAYIEEFGADPDVGDWDGEAYNISTGKLGPLEDHAFFGEEGWAIFLKKFHGIIADLGRCQCGCDCEAWATHRDEGVALCDACGDYHYDADGTCVCSRQTDGWEKCPTCGQPLDWCHDNNNAENADCDCGGWRREEHGPGNWVVVHSPNDDTNKKWHALYCAYHGGGDCTCGLTPCED